MVDFDDFLELEALLTRAADVPDYTWFWWKLRPHPRLGTVELRALDVQFSLRYTSALIALVYCLARDGAEAPPGSDPSAELIEEGVFRAARYGVHADLPDGEGQLRPLRELLSQATARADRYEQDAFFAAYEAHVLPRVR